MQNEDTGSIILAARHEMTKTEQKKIIQSLRGCRGKMDRPDRESFDMFQKRDLDDEELDTLSILKLEQLRSKYLAKKTRSDLEDKWNKLAGKE